MHLYYLVLSLIMILFSTSTTLARDLMDPVVVTATKVKLKDTKAPYASEIYYRKEIEKSGARTVIDFLNQNTSVVIMSNSGNRHEPKIDMRGFGITEGYKNLVITLNGRRLNTIESNPQALGTIPINNIDRIEITKGSGSIMFGDGAQAGTIQLYTRDTTETTLEASAGNYGQQTQAFTTGRSGDKYIITASGLHNGNTGFSDDDPYGDSTNADVRSIQTKLRYFPTESSEIFFEKDLSTLANRYPWVLTRETWDQNPGSNYKSTVGPKKYTRIHTDRDNTIIGGIIDFTSNLKFSLNYAHQYKIVNAEDEGSTTSASNNRRYKRSAFDTSLDYTKGRFRIISGVQTFFGEMIQHGITIGKQNTGVYFESIIDINDTTKLSLGTRGEWVSYAMDNPPEKPTEKDYSFGVYDIGINKSLNDHLSIFSNFNTSFLSPDIDRFAEWNPAFTAKTFNPWISPSTSQNINLGLNYVTPENKLKLTLFNIFAKKELYLIPHNAFINTNLDKTHKYGLELQDIFKFNNELSVSVNYAWTRAIIKGAGPLSSKVACGKCAGNFLPGVAEHNITLGVNYVPTPRSRIVLTQNYRSEAFNEEDIENDDFGHMQRAYTSTDISYDYTFKTDSGNTFFKWWPNGPRETQFIAKIENLFEQSNATHLKIDAIYPDLFTRNWTLGAKFKF